MSNEWLKIGYQYHEEEGSDWAGGRESTKAREGALKEDLCEYRDG